MPIPVIIDTDPGVDDVVALLYALTCPELEILAIIISFGNTDVDSSYNNILKLYDTLARHFERFPADRARFPGFAARPFLARGAHAPLEGELHSAQYFHGRDGLGDISTRYPDIRTGDGLAHVRPTDTPGHELALELLRKHARRTVTYIALGPLTNLALMLRRDRATCRARVGGVVIMGGALDVPGNTSPVAEFNFFADPYAVKEVLIDAETALPPDRVLLLPLDITTPHELSFPLYAARVDPAFGVPVPVPIPVPDPDTPGELGMGRHNLKPPPRPPLTHFTSAFFERTREVMLEFGKDAMELHDVVAVWCAVQNPPRPDDNDDNGHAAPTLALALQDGWEARYRLFQIERTGELTRGMLVVDRRDEITEAAVAAATAATTVVPLPLTASPDSEKRFRAGDNRAEVQAALDRAVHDIPAPVQVELDVPRVNLNPPRGVACIVRTPGADTLVSSMLANIWGEQRRLL
ncbi:hypothetical protein M0805_001705 [Coniferiporia weirii]|nr:hypothetical protein M0805_001705 [Coniferiporia weirii]